MNLQHIAQQIKDQVLPADQMNDLKGGGWGNHGMSSGHGCPPPSLMIQKGWDGDAMS